MDHGGQRSASDRRELEQLAGQMMFVNPGEVHDGGGAGDRMFGQAVCSDARMAWCFEQAYQARDNALQQRPLPVFLIKVISRGISNALLASRPAATAKHGAHPYKTPLQAPAMLSAFKDDPCPLPWHVFAWPAPC